MLMDMQIEETITHLISLPKAHFDQNYGQGKNAVAQQMLNFFMIDSLSSPDIDNFIASSKQRLAELQIAVSPHDLPEEYTYFLERYGGFWLVDEDNVPVFTIAGIGPGMENLYGDIIKINHEETNIKQLRIGSWEQPLPFVELNGKPLSPRLQVINFYIDLAGDLKKDAILTAGPWDYKKPEKEWKILADSFSEWLAKIAKSGGPVVDDP
jgi:hypothetical protein